MRIVIADDAVLLRTGVERLLTDAGHEVVAAVGDASALLSAVSHHQPDLAVIDVTSDGLVLVDATSVTKSLYSLCVSRRCVRR